MAFYIFVFSVALGSCLVVGVMRYRWRLKEQETKEIYELVERIMGKLVNITCEEKYGVSKI